MESQGLEQPHRGRRGQAASGDRNLGRLRVFLRACDGCDGSWLILPYDGGRVSWA